MSSTDGPSAPAPLPPTFPERTGKVDRSSPDRRPNRERKPKPKKRRERDESERDEDDKGGIDIRV